MDNWDRDSRPSGDRPFRDEGTPDAGRSEGGEGRPPFRRDNDRPGGGFGRGGDRPPYTPRPGGDRPPFNSRPGGDRPGGFGRDEGSRPPFRRDNDRPGGGFGRGGDDRPPFQRDNDAPARPPRGDDEQGGRPFGGDRPRTGGFSRSGDDRPPFRREGGEGRPPFRRDNDRPGGGFGRGGDRPSFNNRPSSDRPPGDRAPYVPRGGDDRPPFRRDNDRPGDDRPRGGFGDRDRPSPTDFNERPERGPGGDRPSYGDRRPGGDRPSYGGGGFNRGGDRPPFNSRPGGDRPPFGARPGGFNRDEGSRPPFRRDNDRPGGGFSRGGDRPSYTPRPGGDRRTFNDRPSGGRPFEGRPPRRDERPAWEDEGRPLGTVTRTGRPAVEDGDRLKVDVYGRWPVLESLRANNVTRIYLAAGVRDDADHLREIQAVAAEKHIPVSRVDRLALDRVIGGANHQGIAAATKPHEYATIEGVIEAATAAQAEGDQPLVLVFDGLQDPQNMGSLLRTAEAAGVHGAILPRHQQAGITPAVVRASAGATEHLPVAEVANLRQSIDALKAAGYWVAGLDMEGGTDYDNFDVDGPLALVVGGEGKGISRLVAEQCDYLVKLPMRGRIASLNAAVAAAVVLYDVQRRRDETARRLGISRRPRPQDRPAVAAPVAVDEDVRIVEEALAEDEADEQEAYAEALLGGVEGQASVAAAVEDEDLEDEEALESDDEDDEVLAEDLESEDDDDEDLDEEDLDAEGDADELSGAATVADDGEDLDSDEPAGAPAHGDAGMHGGTDAGAPTGVKPE